MSLDVMARAWKHSRQSGSALLALLALSSSADDDGVIWVRGITVDFIGMKSRTKRRQTQYLLQGLQNDGEIYAPPAAGRGRTTRYFVTIGLDKKQIAAVLIREFLVKPLDAALIADALVERQTVPIDPGEKMQPRASFLDDTAAPEADEPPKKAQHTASIAPTVKGAVQRTKKVQSSAIKGAVQRQENDRSDASGRANADPIRSDQESDPVVGVGDARASFFHALRQRTISRKKAEQIVALGCDIMETVLTSLDNLIDPNNPKTIGGAVEQILDAPPEKGKPYAPQRHERPAQSNIPSDRADRSAPAIARPRGKHAPTGGSDIHDPGWRERLIAEAERAAAEAGITG